MSVTTGEDVAVFYREELGRDVELGPNEEVLTEREGERIVAAVRLAPEAGTLVMRTMVVATGLRHRGIGRRLLRRASASIAERECFCIAWSYLASFYGAAGFETIATESLPRELRARLGAGLIGMRRPPS